MRLEDYNEKDGKRVWLDHDEVDQLLAKAEGDTMREIAFGLMARCGLRGKEVVEVTPPDVVSADTGPRVRVWEGKGNKHREVPLPTGLKASMRAFGDTRDEPNDVPLVDRSTNTLRRWVSRAAEQCHAESGDVGWTHVGPHDLRRTWGTQLVESGVEPGMIMVWGGWEDWETFRAHYLGAYSPEMERRQAALVPWLDVRSPETRSAQSNPRGGASRNRF
jgi:integrase